MSKKLVLEFMLENGKKSSFSLNNIKDISTNESAGFLRNIKFNEIMEFKGQKAEKIVDAEIVSTTSEKITLD